VRVCALEVLYEDALEVSPQVDAIRGEVLEPCSSTFREVELQVLDDEEVVVHLARSTKRGGSLPTTQWGLCP